MFLFAFSCLVFGERGSSLARLLREVDEVERMLQDNELERLGTDPLGARAIGSPNFSTDTRVTKAADSLGSRDGEPIYLYQNLVESYGPVVDPYDHKNGCTRLKHRQFTFSGNIFQKDRYRETCRGWGAKVWVGIPKIEGLLECYEKGKVGKRKDTCEPRKKYFDDYFIDTFLGYSRVAFRINPAELAIKVNWWCGGTQMHDTWAYNSKLVGITGANTMAARHFRVSHGAADPGNVIFEFFKCPLTKCPQTIRDKKLCPDQACKLSFNVC